MRYMEEQLVSLKSEYPTYKRSQLLEIIHKNVSELKKVLKFNIFSGRKHLKIPSIKLTLNLTRKSNENIL
jgi:hypothetical protein